MALSGRRVGSCSGVNIFQNALKTIGGKFLYLDNFGKGIPYFGEILTYLDFSNFVNQRQGSKDTYYANFK